MPLYFYTIVKPNRYTITLLYYYVVTQLCHCAFEPLRFYTTNMLLFCCEFYRSKQELGCRKRIMVGWYSCVIA